MTDPRMPDRELVTAETTETAEESFVRMLIESAGPAPSAPEASRARVYASAQDAWRRMVMQRRARTRGYGWMAAAATVAAVAFVLTLRDAPRAPEDTAVAGAPVATVAKIVGSVYVIRAGAERRLSADAGRGEIVRAGESLSTSADGGVALAYEDGLSLRVGEDSLLVLESATKAALERGLVYVDAGTTAARGSAASFELETPLGSVRHTGTQYEAAVREGTVTVRVREGSVEVVDGARAVSGEAGQEIALDEGAEPRTRAIATHGVEWAWVEELAAIEARDSYPVAELLDWIAREMGRRLEYASLDAETSAAAAALHGLQGLTPQEALEVVAGTTRLGYRLVDDRLVVTMR